MRNMLFSLCIVAQALNAQYSVEWLKPININYGENRFVGLTTDSAEKLYFIGRSFASPSVCVLYCMDSNGTVIFNKNITHANTFQIYKNYIYTLAHQYVKMDLSGNMIWQKTLDWKDNIHFQTNAAAIWNDHLYSPYSVLDLLKFDLDGNQEWRVNIDSAAAGNYQIFVSQSHIYLNSFSYANGFRIFKYDTLGNLEWKLPGNPTKIIVDSKGNIYLLSYGQIVKINSLGEPEWFSDIERMQILDATVENDTLYACGEYDLKVGPESDERLSGLAILSAKTGSLLSRQNFNFYTSPEFIYGQEESFTNIQKHGNALYLGGSHNFEFSYLFLVKLRAQGTMDLKEERSETSLLNIYPNPTGRAFTVIGKSTGSSLEVTIKSVLGKIVYKQTIFPSSEYFSESIDPGVLPKGVYFVELSSGESRQIAKIVVE
jgi:hypothetical protein